MSRTPALFIGHGSPLNALAANDYTRRLAEAGRLAPAPQAVLCVSAHWESAGTWVNAQARPKTIHDFRGFPRELHEKIYPAPGAPELAREISALLGTRARGTTLDWGLDHGAWSVLVHLFPKADVPVLQLSMDRALAPSERFEIGRALAPLRERGVWILGSGDLVHNLYEMNPDRGPPYPWAEDFERNVMDRIAARDFAALTAPSFYAQKALGQSHPSLEHFWPLLYVLGATHADDRLAMIHEGFELGTISLTSFAFVP